MNAADKRRQNDHKKSVRRREDNKRGKGSGKPASSRRSVDHKSATTAARRDGQSGHFLLPFAPITLVKDMALGVHDFVTRGFKSRMKASTTLAAGTLPDNRKQTLMLHFGFSALMVMALTFGTVRQLSTQTNYSTKPTRVTSESSATVIRDTETPNYVRVILPKPQQEHASFSNHSFNWLSTAWQDVKAYAGPILSKAIENAKDDLRLLKIRAEDKWYAFTGQTPPNVFGAPERPSLREIIGSHGRTPLPFDAGRALNAPQQTLLLPLNEIAQVAAQARLDAYDPIAPKPDVLFAAKTVDAPVQLDAYEPVAPKAEVLFALPKTATPTPAEKVSATPEPVTPPVILLPKMLKGLMTQDSFNHLPEKLQAEAVSLSQTKNPSAKNLLGFYSDAGHQLLNNQAGPLSLADQKAVTMMFRKGATVAYENGLLETPAGKLVNANLSYVMRIGMGGPRDLTKAAFHALLAQGSKVGDRALDTITRQAPEVVQNLQAKMPAYKQALGIG